MLCVVRRLSLGSCPIGCSVFQIRCSCVVMEECLLKSSQVFRSQGPTIRAQPTVVYEWLLPTWWALNKRSPWAMIASKLRWRTPLRSMQLLVTPLSHMRFQNEISHFVRTGSRPASSASLSLCGSLCFALCAGGVPLSNTVVWSSICAT